MDCMLPASVNYNGKKYYLTNEKISSFSEKNNLTNEILNDGRMAWVDGSDLYVEDAGKMFTGTRRKKLRYRRR